MAIHTHYNYDSQRNSGVASNSYSTMNGDPSSTDGILSEEQLEQYRLMAQIEANVRVLDNTGFDREEYDRQQRESGDSSRVRPRPVSFFATADTRPQPALPESKMDTTNSSSFSSSIGSRMGSGAIINGSSRSMRGLEAAEVAANSAAVLAGPPPAGPRPEEPQLPPRRANRRYVEHPRPPEVGELCDGIVVQLPDGTPVTTTTVVEESEEDVKQEESPDLGGQPSPSHPSNNSNSVDANDPNHVIVDCWGCRCRLRAHRLASLVKCSQCLTVSPSIPKGR